MSSCIFATPQKCIIYPFERRVSKCEGQVAEVDTEVWKTDDDSDEDPDWLHDGDGWRRDGRMLWRRASRRIYSLGVGRGGLKKRVWMPRRRLVARLTLTVAAVNEAVHF